MCRPYVSLCKSGLEENVSNSSRGVGSERRVLCPREGEECLQGQLDRPSEESASSQSQPRVFHAPRKTKLHKRHGKLGQSQNGSIGKRKQKENSC